MNIEYCNPTELKQDNEGHVRLTPNNPSNNLKQNIEKIGKIVEPIHARNINNEIFVFDGWKRVLVCRNIDMKIPVLVYDNLDDSKALIKSLILNDNKAGVMKNVTSSDREKSLMEYLTAERRTIGKFEDKSKLDKVKYDLGIYGEKEMLNNKIGHIEGIGSELSHE